MILQFKYWTYKQKLIPSFVFEPLLTIMNEYCTTGTSKRRRSCVFDNIHGKPMNLSNNIYKNILYYDWKDSTPILHEICNIVEDFTKESYDYVLVHIYGSGESGINWHNDSEAMNSPIASISLGATRKFRFRKINRKIGWDTEIKLNNGDLVWMHGPNLRTNSISCQNKYYHTIPVEKTIKEPRINLTFRQYE